MNVGTQIKQSFDGWRLMSTPFVFGLLLLLTPILLMVLLSFWTQDYLDLDRTFTLANYKEVFSHPVFITLIKRSVVISLFVTAIYSYFGFPSCLLYFFLRRKKKGSTFIFNHHTFLDQLFAKDFSLEDYTRVQRRN